jgi:hypothetical protein
MTYVYPAWKFAADKHLMKLQRLQNKVLHITDKFQRSTPIRDMHMAFQIPYVYDYITKSCRQQSQVIKHHENGHFRNIGQSETRHTKYTRFKLGGGQAYGRSRSPPPHNPTLFAICTSTCNKLCKKLVQWHVEEC